MDRNIVQTNCAKIICVECLSFAKNLLSVTEVVIMFQIRSQGGCINVTVSIIKGMESMQWSKI